MKANPDYYAEGMANINVNPEKGIENFTMALKEDPENYLAWFHRGMCKVKLGEKQNNETLLDESNQDFEQAVALVKKQGFDWDDLNGLSVKEFKKYNLLEQLKIRVIKPN